MKTKYAKPVDMINHLWVGPSKQRKKTKACPQLEEFFGICFDSHRDFQIVCKNCYRSMCNALKEKENKTGKLKVACSLKQRYLRLRFKRTIPSDFEEDTPAPKFKKKLNSMPRNTVGSDFDFLSELVPSLFENPRQDSAVKLKVSQQNLMK